MNRRTFLQSALAASVSLAVSAAPRGAFGLGYNTYSLRGLKLSDRGYLDKASAWNLAALFLQVTFDPGAEDPKHWAEVKSWARDLHVRLETGGNIIVPASRNCSISLSRRSAAVSNARRPWGRPSAGRSAAHGGTNCFGPRWKKPSKLRQPCSER